MPVDAARLVLQSAHWPRVFPPVLSKCTTRPDSLDVGRWLPQTSSIAPHPESRQTQPTVGRVRDCYRLISKMSGQSTILYLTGTGLSVNIKSQPRGLTDGFILTALRALSPLPEFLVPDYAKLPTVLRIITMDLTASYLSHNFCFLWPLGSD